MVGLAFADEDHSSCDDGYFEDLPVVLTPSRLPQPLREAPAAVTVLDGDLIRATGYRDIARLFRLVPGMQVGQERGSSQWVTYHGLANDAPAEMQVLVDGRAVYSPTTFAGVDWPALPVTIDEIERIEIVRGTNPVAFGPNAFLGVINIITRQAGDAPGAQATASAGNAGIRDLRATWSSPPGDHALRIAAAIRHDDGFAGLYDHARMDTLSLRSDHSLGNHDQLTFRVAGSRNDRQSGFADSLFNNDGERASDTRNTAFQAQWRHAPATGEEWLVNFFRNETHARDEWTAIGPRIDLLPATVTAYVPLNRNRETTRNSVEVQHHAPLSPATRIVWGGELRHESIESPFMFFGTNAVDTSLYRLFGNVEWRTGATVTTNFGAMADKYSDDRTRLAPRAFVNWQATPGSTLRAGYSRAWRDRNAFDRHGDVRVVDPADGRLLVHPYLPNPALVPPRVDSFELGWLASFRPGETKVDLRLFNERIAGFVIRRAMPATDDQPVLASYMPPTMAMNLDKPVTLRGIEYQIQTRPLPDTRILFSHAMIDRRTADDCVRARVSPYTATLSWMENWPGQWSSMASLLRMGPQAGGDGFLTGYRYQAAPYWTVDASLRRALRIGGHSAGIALSAINLGPRHQEIPDRSEQALHPEGPVNPVSRMIFLSLTIGQR